MPNKAWLFSCPSQAHFLWTAGCVAQLQYLDQKYGIAEEEVTRGLKIVEQNWHTATMLTPHRSSSRDWILRTQAAWRTGKRNCVRHCKLGEKNFPKAIFCSPSRRKS